MPRPPGSSRLYCYLLELDDDLAQELDTSLRFSARQHATVRLLESDTGDCDLDGWLDAVGDGLGLLVVDGLMAVDTRVADRTATELIGSGDLVQPDTTCPYEMVEHCAAWHALQPTQLALLDADFVDRVRPWPQLLGALFRRAERRQNELSLLRAVASQPKLDVRLLLLFWHLATRWGRVEHSGVHLTLPLTHRLLGQLVAAERPSISHALARLSQAGIVTGSAGDLHLHGTLESQLESLTERPAELNLESRERVS
ncbi:MAG: helix-turn-helix domain-containing protein [Conexibacteraceae bacterium]|nr:helix-turn-helix domain-containing protein [Conexibacteraceae bacterium]